MKFETTLELDEEGSSIEEVLVQLQKSFTKVIVLTNDTDIEFKELSSLKPFVRWELEDKEETPYGTIYTVRRLSLDNGGDDDSFDDEDESWTVFRQDAFDALTKQAKSKKGKKSKGKKTVTTEGEEVSETAAVSEVTTAEEVSKTTEADSVVTVKPVAKPLFPVQELQSLLSRMKESSSETGTGEVVVKKEKVKKEKKVKEVKEGKEEKKGKEGKEGKSHKKSK